MVREENEGVLVTGDAVAGTDGQLLHVRAAQVGGLADVFDVDRHVAPAEELLVLGLDRGDDQLLEQLAAGFVAGKEAHGDAVLAGRGQVEVDVLPEEQVGHLDQDPGAVTGVGLGTRGASWLGSLSRRATMATPQASCSNLGSYIPSADGYDVLNSVIFSQRLA